MHMQVCVYRSGICMCVGGVSMYRPMYVHRCVCVQGLSMCKDICLGRMCVYAPGSVWVRICK